MYVIVWLSKCILSDCVVVARYNATYLTPRLMFGSLRSLWIFVDPRSDKPNLTEDDFTYDDAENEIIMLTNTEENIPAGMRHNVETKRQKSSQVFS